MADSFLQRLDAVGWTSGRASSMEEITPAVPRGGALEGLRAPGLTGSDLWKNRLHSQKLKVVVVMVMVVL